jgi:hypothetical protein
MGVGLTSALGIFCFFNLSCKIIKIGASKKNYMVVVLVNKRLQISKWEIVNNWDSLYSKNKRFISYKMF